MRLRYSSILCRYSVSDALFCYDYNNRNGFLFVIVINQGFNTVTAVLATFPREKLIVNR